MSQQFDLYTEITKQIMEMLEKGVVPWRSPIMGQGTAGHPKNLDSGKQYRGINTFLLAFTAYAKGYGSSYWMTFNQAKEHGGSVKKGEKSTMIVFWKELEGTDKQTGEPTKHGMLRYYNVFNAEQCSDIAVPDAPKWEPIDFKPLDECEKIIKGYQNAPVIEHGGTQAFYRPSNDTIKLPEPTRFTSAEDYYGTAFHEAAHSTGHSTRLDRKLDTDTHPFGSEAYGKEELVAEMSAAYLCARAGIAPVTIENSAAYLAGWLKTIKADKKLVIAAASAAQKATDWILGETHTPTP